MRVEASKVVPGGVQLGSLDQLQGQQPGESGLYFMPSPVSAVCVNLFYVFPSAITPPCECLEIRDSLSKNPCFWCRSGAKEMLWETVG